jgi:hypothetical protein
MIDNDSINWKFVNWGFKYSRKLSWVNMNSKISLALFFGSDTDISTLKNLGIGHIPTPNPNTYTILGT